jgi:hypothetical protein
MRGVAVALALALALAAAAVCAAQRPVADENVAVPVQLNATDPNNRPLTYAVVTLPTRGAITGFSSAVGSFTFTPLPNYAGPDAFTYTASNGQQASIAAVVRAVERMRAPALTGCAAGDRDRGRCESGADARRVAAWEALPPVSVRSDVRTDCQ